MTTPTRTPDTNPAPPEPPTATDTLPPPPSPPFPEHPGGSPAQHRASRYTAAPAETPAAGSAAYSPAAPAAKSYY